MSLQIVNLHLAAKYIKAAIKSNLVAYLAGSPGMGKSAMIYAIAAEYNLKVIDLRLAQEDPTTINGFPNVSNGRSRYLPPETFPLQSDPLPLKPEFNTIINRTNYMTLLKAKKAKPITDFQKKYCYAGWLLFFDELPSAPKSVQAASYKIILDRMIGQKKLHSKCAMLAAGNLLTDGAIVYEMGSALRSRLVHIHVKSNPQDFLSNVAPKIGLDLRISAYLNYKNSNVNNFSEYNKGSSDETFACERTWDMASKLVKEVSPDENKPIPDQWSTMLAGTVGSCALEFVQFTHAFDQLPTFKEIINDPTKATIPNKPAVRWLLTSLLVGNTDMSNIDDVMDYVDRLPKEFQFATAKMMWAKDDSLLDNPKLEAKFTEIGSILIG